MRKISMALALALASTTPLMAQDAPSRIEASPELEQWMDGVRNEAMNSTALKDGANWAGEVAPQEAGSPPDTLHTEKSKPVADWNGVDLDAMMSRYGFKKDDVVKEATALHPLMVFVSFSMDDDYLTELSRQVRNAGGVLVIRGLINNSMKDTAFKLHELQGEEVGAILDPTLFSKYDITHAPTFVVTRQPDGRCLDAACAQATPSHDKIAGNVSLEYALSAMASRGEGAPEVAANILKAMRVN